MLYRVITAMAVLYLEAWYTLGSWLRNVEHVSTKGAVLPSSVGEHHPHRKCDGRTASSMETTGLFAWLRGILGDAGEACMAFTCTGFRLQPLHREPPLEPLLRLYLLHWSLCYALWWRRKGVQSALFSTFLLLWQENEKPCPEFLLCKQEQGTPFPMCLLYTAMLPLAAARRNPS